MREETEEGRERDKQRQGGEKDWRAEGMRVRKGLRCMGDMERDRESRLSWPTLHKERTASLKVTLKHTFAEKLSHLNLAELAVGTCRTVRCGVGVCRYQMTCNPSCLSSMCLSLFFSSTHTLTNTLLHLTKTCVQVSKYWNFSLTAGSCMPPFSRSCYFRGHNTHEH